MQRQVVCGGFGFITASVVMIFAGGEMISERFVAGISGLLIGVVIGVGILLLYFVIDTVNDIKMKRAQKGNENADN